MEQNIYDLLTKLIQLAVLIIGYLAAKKTAKRKTTRRLSRNQAKKGNNPSEAHLDGSSIGKETVV